MGPRRLINTQVKTRKGYASLGIFVEASTAIKRVSCSPVRNVDRRCCAQRAGYGHPGVGKKSTPGAVSAAWANAENVLKQHHEHCMYMKIHNDDKWPRASAGRIGSCIRTWVEICTMTPFAFWSKVCRLVLCPLFSSIWSSRFKSMSYAVLWVMRRGWMCFGTFILIIVILLLHPSTSTGESTY